MNEQTKPVIRQRQQLVGTIRSNIKPLLWESGYAEDSRDFTNTNRLKLYSFDDAFDNPRKLRNGFVIKEYMGFTLDGVITDAYGGGLCITTYRAIPVEDLQKLVKVTETLSKEANHDQN